MISAIEELGPISRAALARATGLPGSTIVGLVSKLLADGVLTETPSQSTRGTRASGRPAKLISLAGQTGLVAGFAISRHEIRVGVIGVDGTLLAEAATAMQSLEVADIVSPMIGLFVELLGTSGIDRSAVTSAVIGVPGPFRRGVGVVPLRDVPEPIRRFFPGSTPGWMQHDPAPDVASRLGVPAVAENDANLGALGEAVYGAASGLGSVIYLKYAQGLGAGIVIGGRPVRGASGQAGELAHVRVDDDGPVCGCGGRGCLGVMTSPERFLAALRYSYHDADAQNDIIALAEHGDPGVLRLLHDAGRRMGRPLADFCTMFNPDALVLDARLGAAAIPVLAGIRETIDRYALAPAAEAVQVLPGTLGDNAELLGAAALARLEGLGRLTPAGPPRLRREPGTRPAPT
jgi:predicted NBD/HSP70 family sugar kinase